MNFTLLVSVGWVVVSGDAPFGVYFTPIFYPVSALPETIAKLIKFNPLYTYITLFRELLLYGRFPALSMWATGLIISVVTMLLGALIFRKMQRRFILYI